MSFKKNNLSFGIDQILCTNTCEIDEKRKNYEQEVGKCDGNMGNSSVQSEETVAGGTEHLITRLIVIKLLIVASI